MNTTSPILTILIPHYKTLSLLKLCLQYLKKYTDLNKVKVIVIDNNSADGTVEFLQTVKWVTLIERKSDEHEDPGPMHAKALDLGLEKVDTPYVLSIHTDTIVANEKWLDFLMGEIKKSDNIAGVGSWKLEYISPLKLVMKHIEQFLQTKIWYPIVRKKDHKISGLGDNYYYLRSHCALYRTELIRRYTNGFYDANTAGKVLHKKLIDAGFEMVFLPSEILIKYIKHLNHATMILHPELGGKKTATSKAYKRIMKEMKALNYEEMLNRESL